MAITDGLSVAEHLQSASSYEMTFVKATIGKGIFGKTKSGSLTTRLVW
jgi:hypothetical protein